MGFHYEHLSDPARQFGQLALDFKIQQAQKLLNGVQE